MSTEEMDDSKSNFPSEGKKNKSATPVLDNFGKDLTKMAATGKIEQVVGREIEIDRIIQILSRKKKNNPILVGPSGSGKSAIIDALALRIVEKKVSTVLHDKRIINLDLSSIVAGTKYRGQFEERMKAIINEIENNPNVIIFIDEVHTIIGAGNASGSLDLSNMIKPALSRGSMQIIGATTIEEYKKSIEKDAAMERRFQKVQINEPSIEETKIILKKIKYIYEDFHNVIFDDSAVDSAVDYSVRYITSRHLPDKAIDILDEVGARVHLDNLNMPIELENLDVKLTKLVDDKKESINKQNYEYAAKLRDKERELLKEIEIATFNWKKEQKEKKTVVTQDDIAKVVSKMVGIPVTQMTEDESARLLKMESFIKKKVIGQDHAVKKVSEAIRRSKIGFHNANKPLASFLFLGKTATGKTQLAKALAEFLFNNETSLIRLDMSEYMEAHSITKIIGSPPSYVGYGDSSNQLTEQVRNNPYSVVLFDEIEKAHPNITNILLQILDEGRLTDSEGLTINFKNTIIIMTSNAGTQELSNYKPMGFDATNLLKNEMVTKDIIDKALGKIFRKETLNRIDEQVIFNSLTKENILEIADIHIENFLNVVREKGYKVKSTQALKEFVANEGFSEEFGVRPILRIIVNFIQNRVTNAVLNKEIVVGDNFTVDYVNNEVVLKKQKIKTPKAA